MAERPKIFVQFVNLPGISMTAGDRINEIRFYRSLSTFADVYYNDILVDPEATSVGTTGAPGELNHPSRDYDLYYVRGNHELFQSLPHPKITMSYPYDAHSFSIADAMIVTTAEWKRLLSDYNESAQTQTLLAKWYPDQIQAPRAIVNIRQSLDPRVMEVVTDRQLWKWRVATTLADNVFGFFGRVTDETIPQSVVQAVDYTRNRLGTSLDPICAFAGSVRTQVPDGALNLGQVPYEEMGALVRACTATMGQECQDSSFLGSGKILDSVAALVPIVCRRNPVRIEQLGEEYPGMFDNQEEANALVYGLCTDPGLHKTIATYLERRREELTTKAIGRHIHAELKDAGILS